MLNFINFPSRREVPPILFAVLLALFVTSDEAHAFGKKPVTLPEKPVETKPPETGPVDPNSIIRARWEGKARDGVEWSKYVFNRIPVTGPNLLKKTPADISQFCANYSNLNETDKKNFWLYLISSMTELESSFNPNTTYLENFYDQYGNQVVSAGLMQLSITDVKYGCDFKTNNDLFDPYKNLDCGIRILNKWLEKDGRLAGKVGTAWAGGARYWSVLRKDTSLAKIQSWNQAQRICAK